MAIDLRTCGFPYAPPNNPLLMPPMRALPPVVRLQGDTLLPADVAKQAAVSLAQMCCVACAGVA